MMNYSWTEEEDYKCLKIVKEFLKSSNQLERYNNTHELVMSFSWIDIANKMKTRTASECRERFLLVLSPKSHKKCWSSLEKELLELLAEKYSNDVTVLVKYFPTKVKEDIERVLPKLKDCKRKRDELDLLLDDIVSPSEKKCCRKNMLTEELTNFEDILNESNFCYDEEEFAKLLETPLETEDTFLDTNILNLISCF